MPGKTLGIILAGGQGSRLNPLTRERAKPAVPFGGTYRIIDFVLANFLNSAMRKILVVTQYAPDSLYEHVQNFWAPLMGFGESINLVSPKMRHEHEFMYRGTADAVWQTWGSIVDRRPNVERVAIFGGDHIYKMDISQVVRYHSSKKSAFTICVEVVPVETAAEQLGVLRVDTSNRILEFVEKPKLEDVPHIPDRKGWCYASMGNYVAEVDVLGKILSDDASRTDSSHDFGRDIIPEIRKRGLPIYAYPFHLNEIEGEQGHYWRDVGTLAAYHAASTDLLDFVPRLNLRNENWKIPTYPPNQPSAMTLGTDVASIHTSAAGGTIVHNARTYWSILGRNNRVEQGASVENSILFDDVTVGKGARIRFIICDKEVVIPRGTTIGYNRQEDEARGFTIEPLNDNEWLSVIPKRYRF